MFKSKFGFVLLIVLACSLAIFLFARAQTQPVDNTQITPSSTTTIPTKSATDAPRMAPKTWETTVWVDGLKTPWALEFLDANTALITEKSGRLRRVVDGQLQEEAVIGTPEVWSGGQGGLLDVAIDPDYAENGWVYLTFSHPLAAGSDKAMTKLVRGKIVDNVWSDEQVLFAAKSEHYIKGRVHFGSRITFDDKGHVFFSIGDRGQMDMAQDVTRPNGKVHRLMRGGTIPKDNPFVNRADAYPSIYSYGNRNPQGLVWADGVLWATEHGPKGGDELNIIKSGVNYGWPVISYGRNYSGTELTPYTHMEGMEQPISQWTPSIAVTGLEVISGDMFKDWNGYLLAGALKYREVRLIKIDGDKYISEQILLKDQGRVRDITMGPDGTIDGGAIYVVLNGPSQVLKITSKKEN
ncbi:MAG: PQQ-dependent sugar dehydrogenase [Robiginitomaculum sp.]|nr:PQQ-dependent sugar dehydrogenase [Robiginitomaculum sp.]